MFHLQRPQIFVFPKFQFLHRLRRHLHVRRLHAQPTFDRIELHRELRRLKSRQRLRRFARVRVHLIARVVQHLAERVRHPRHRV